MEAYEVFSFNLKSNHHARGVRGKNTKEELVENLVFKQVASLMPLVMILGIKSKLTILRYV
jgi:hypothetical protein